MKQILEVLKKLKNKNKSTMTFPDKLKGIVANTICYIITPDLNSFCSITAKVKHPLPLSLNKNIRYGTCYSF